MQSEKNKKSRLVISLMLSVCAMLMGVAYVYWHSSTQVEIAIRVVDSSTSQSVPSAQVNVSTDQSALVGVTDSEGLFVIKTVLHKTKTLLVTVGADGYLVERRELNASSGRDLLQIPLTRIAPQDGQSKTKTITTTAELNGGDGTNWGAPFRLCSTSAPPGYKLATSEFYLVGDRQCGAWAECRQVQKDDSGVCWDVRIQGNGTNRTRALGVLNITVERSNDSPEQLGEAYWMGRGVTLNYSEALKWFRIGAEQGDPRAMANIGWIYENGFGVKRDYSEARRWYEMAARQGDAIANWNLGRMYQYGYGVPTDLGRAIEYFRIGVAKGDVNSAQALKELGVVGGSGSQAIARQVCHLYGEAEQGSNAFNRDDGCTIPDASNLDVSYRQVSFACCGGGATSPTTVASIPPGLELRVTGGHYWSVSNPNLIGDRFSIHTYCGPEPAPGPGCNVNVQVIAHYRTKG